jgi:hypothetical protein
MVIHAYIMAVLIGAAVGEAADMLPREDQDVLIAADGVLADVEQLCVTIATHDTKQLEQLIDTPKLKARVEEELREAGIRPVPGQTGLEPRLVAHIEGVAVPECDKYVYRIQTSLNRLVTFSNRKDVQIQAEVWQVRPVMKVVARAEAAEAIAADVLMQAEAFVGACKTAWGLRQLTEGASQNPSGPGPSNQTQPNVQSLQAVSGYPFVASRNSSVFHRPDCRWAQNIAADNLVGYRSREEALQAGKRPCKSCKP